MYFVSERLSIRISSDECTYVTYRGEHDSWCHPEQRLCVICMLPGNLRTERKLRFPRSTTSSSIGACHISLTISWSNIIIRVLVQSLVYTGSQCIVGWNLIATQCVAHLGLTIIIIIIYIVLIKLFTTGWWQSVVPPPAIHKINILQRCNKEDSSSGVFFISEGNLLLWTSYEFRDAPILYKASRYYNGQLNFSWSGWWIRNKN